MLSLYFELFTSHSLFQTEHYFIAAAGISLITWKLFVYLIVLRHRPFSMSSENNNNPLLLFTTVHSLRIVYLNVQLAHIQPAAVRPHTQTHTSPGFYIASLLLLCSEERKTVRLRRTFVGTVAEYRHVSQDPRARDGELITVWTA